MGAPKGNQFWKFRTKHGRNKIFSSPKILWDECCKYFQWVEDNPLTEEKLFAYQGEISRDTIQKMRAMTIDGLCFYLKINQSTWFEYAKDKDFSNVICEAENVIRSQKFAGAAADLLNANIIARDLGLKDKSELTGKDGAPLMKGSADDYSDEELLAVIEGRRLKDG